VGVELVQNRRQRFCDQRLQFAQRLPRRGVDPDEIKARSQGLVIVHGLSCFLIGRPGGVPVTYAAHGEYFGNAHARRTTKSPLS
jgi:hypothetical protein